MAVERMTSCKSPIEYRARFVSKPTVQRTDQAHLPPTVANRVQ